MGFQAYCTTLKTTLACASKLGRLGCCGAAGLAPPADEWLTEKECLPGAYSAFQKRWYFEPCVHAQLTDGGRTCGGSRVTLIARATRNLGQSRV